MISLLLVGWNHLHNKPTERQTGQQTNLKTGQQTNQQITGRLTGRLTSRSTVRSANRQTGTGMDRLEIFYHRLHGYMIILVATKLYLHNKVNFEVDKSYG